MDNDNDKIEEYLKTQKKSLKQLTFDIYFGIIKHFSEFFHLSNFPANFIVLQKFYQILPFNYKVHLLDIINPKIDINKSYLGQLVLDLLKDVVSDDELFKSFKNLEHIKEYVVGLIQEDNFYDKQYKSFDNKITLENILEYFTVREVDRVSHEILVKRYNDFKNTHIYDYCDDSWESGDALYLEENDEILWDEYLKIFYKDASLWDHFYNLCRDVVKFVYQDLFAIGKYVDKRIDGEKEKLMKLREIVETLNTKKKAI